MRSSALLVVDVITSAAAACSIFVAVVSAVAAAFALTPLVAAVVSATVRSRALALAAVMMVVATTQTARRIAFVAFVAIAMACGAVIIVPAAIRLLHAARTRA